MSTVLLTEQPKTSDIYTRAALGFLGSPSSGSAPSTVFELPGFRVDPDNLASYARVCGLRFGDTLPLTYPFTFVFPTVMKLMVSKGFPLKAIGSVHAENVIEQVRPISVTEPLDIRVHAENLREHRKGLLIDLVSEINVGRELVWKQTSTFLSLQKTSLSGGPREAPPADAVPPPPMRTLRVDQSTISKYAAVSGDRNPIHVSSLGAKAFGFPRTIAHGMWSAAAILQAIEGRIAPSVTYRVKFGKPIVLPSTINVYAAATESGWDLSLLNPKKGYPYLTGTLSH